MRLIKMIPACAVAACAFSTSALAQGAAPAAVDLPELAPQVGLPAPSAVTTRVVAIRNLPASVMAFLLDAKKQPEPLIVQMGRQNNLLLEPGAASPSVAERMGRVPGPLPPGVTIEKVTDDQNSLTLRGKPADLEAWESEIRKLDKPLRQVQIESQLMRLSAADLRELGVPVDGPGPHPLAREANVRLSEMVRRHAARVVSAPRVVAISGLAASLSSSMGTPTRLVPVTKGSAARRDLPEEPVMVWSRVGMTVRPEVRADGAIAMEVAVGRSLWIGDAEPPTPPPLGRRASFQARDGDSYVLFTEPDPPAPAPTPQNSYVPAAPAEAAPKTWKPRFDKDGRASVAIMTARVIRRYQAEADPQQ